MSCVYRVEHPLVEHHLSQLRSEATPPSEFRALVGRLATLLAYEATQDLPLHDVSVQTPMTTMTGRALRGRIGIVPILRAGLGMVDPVLNLIPSAEVWHLGVYRDEKTAQPIEYYSRIPKSHPVDTALVLDPMLATGGSATAALAMLQAWRVPSLKLLSIIASQEGIERVASEYPTAQIFVCAIDPLLNNQKFIVPGLGDAGDRIFNTHGRE